MRAFYAVIWSVIWPFFNLVHPVRCAGRENLPAGAAVVCGNHTAMSDPFFLVFAAGLKNQMRVMAKAELMRMPVIGWLLKMAGVFGVERGKADVGAIKTAMKYLKSGEKVLLFPEGTRVKNGLDKDGHESEAKTGAAMLAMRTGVPLVPVYIPEKKNWFRFTTVVVGEAYYPQAPSGEKRATAEDYRAVAADLMERVSALGGVGA